MYFKFIFLSLKRSIKTYFIYMIDWKNYFLYNLIKFIYFKFKGGFSMALMEDL